MAELDTILGEVLAREEPTVLPSEALIEAVAELEQGRDLPMTELTRLAFSDPAVAAELISAANAGRSAPDIASLPAALDEIGEATFVAVLRAQCRPHLALRAEGPLHALRHRAWRVAVVSANLCRELAEARGLDADVAYACGLLHDVGRLATLAAVERYAAGSRLVRGASMARWEAVADRWHVVLGAGYAERLALPQLLFDAIGFHHAPPIAGTAAAPLLDVVRSVDALVSVIVSGADPGEAVDAGELTDGEAALLAKAVLRMQAQSAAADRLPRPLPVPADRRAVARPQRARGLRIRLAGNEYTTTGFAPHQLVVTGPAPLGEGALLEASLADRDAPAFHVRVLTVWAEGARFGAILLPFGVCGPSLAELGGSLPAGAAA